MQSVDTCLRNQYLKSGRHGIRRLKALLISSCTCFAGICEQLIVQTMQNISKSKKTASKVFLKAKNSALTQKQKRSCCPQQKYPSRNVIFLNQRQEGVKNFISLFKIKF